MRNTFHTQLTIQLDNPVQPMQWGAPVLITSVVVVTNDAGQSIYQPTHHVQPAVDEDITDELLAALQAKLGAIGLDVTRKV